MTAQVPTFWPPAPHDPRDRELALLSDGWEIRLFGGRMFEYFVTRGFWHLQLWHPSGVSVLTPSRLTCDRYEAFPFQGWKTRSASYDDIVARIAPASRVRLPPRAYVERLRRCLVDDVVRGAEAHGERLALS